MAARLEVHVERGSPGRCAGTADGEDLRMIQAGTTVEPDADHAAAAHDHGTDHRVGAGGAAPPCGKGERLPELRTVIKAGFGFGDVNACLVFSAYQDN